MDDTPTDDDDRGRHTDDVRRAQAKLTDLHQRRRQCLRQRERGEVEQDDLVAWQVALVDTVESLRPWRDRAGRAWENAGPDWLDGLDDLHRHTGAVEREVVTEVGFGRAKQTTETRHRLLPVETLVALSRELEDIAESQGLEAGPAENADSVRGGKL